MPGQLDTAEVLFRHEATLSSLSTQVENLNEKVDKIDVVMERVDSKIDQTLLLLERHDNSIKALQWEKEQRIAHKAARWTWVGGRVWSLVSAVGLAALLAWLGLK